MSILFGAAGHARQAGPEAAPESEAAEAIVGIAEQLAAHRPGGIRTALTVLS